MEKKVYIIVACDEYGGIGKDGKIPWTSSSDMQYFKNMTMGSTVVMGRVTWESIPRGLPGREVIVVTSSVLSGVKTASSLRLAIDSASSDKVFICGGESIYNEALEAVDLDNIYITRIAGNYHCDRFYNGDISANLETEEGQYLRLLSDLMETPLAMERSMTRSIFGADLHFDLRKGFPLLTTKKMFWRGIVEELLFFIRGDTDSKHLENVGVNIWKQNTLSEYIASRGLSWREGDMGPMYGFNWRHYGAEYTGCGDYRGKGHDQLQRVIDQLRDGERDRRAMMTTFNPAVVDQGVLPPCHGITTQFYLADGFLHCKTYQRSADVFLGLPFNIASYALFVHIIASIIGAKVGNLDISIGSAHVYEEHEAAVIEQLWRSPRQLPTICVMVTDIDNITASMISLNGYYPHDSIKAPIIT